VPDVAYVNGRIGPLSRAVVRVQDRGFLLADGVYEVLRSYGGRIFALRAHLDRLDGSLAGLQLRAPMSRRRLANLLDSLLRRSTYREARIYVQVTRGVAPRQHAFPARARPTLVVYVERIHPVAPAQRQRGVAAITLADPRWRRCDLKTIALLPNVLAKQRAFDAGVHEAIFIGPGDVVREASTANVFAVHGRRLTTHPLDVAVLPGVSRAIVLELGRAAGMQVREARLRRAALYAADEVFLSSTMQEVLPVVRIDGRRIGNGRPGPWGRELERRFRQRVAAATAPERAAAPGD
jgi:D-alanine transaminase